MTCKLLSAAHIGFVQEGLKDEKACGEKLEKFVGELKEQIKKD